MILIFAVDRNWSIGVDGDMLFKISSDLQRFKKITMGGILIMGRKTFESLPGSNPLPGRTNIVVTRNEDYKKDGIIVVNSIEEMDKKLEELNPENERKVFLIGGGDLVAQLIDRCSYANITKVDSSFEKWDTRIPNLDELGWKILSESEEKEESGLKYKYCEYER
ncbi:MAG: dihydrofolate reductase [Tissierellia bacterium]|nr:dihydrofolate reductase [Tissierellia bacterium]